MVYSTVDSTVPSIQGKIHHSHYVQSSPVHRPGPPTSNPHSCGEPVRPSRGRSLQKDTSALTGPRLINNTYSSNKSALWRRHCVGPLGTNTFSAFLSLTIIHSITPPPPPWFPAHLYGPCASIYDREALTLRAWSHPIPSSRLSILARADQPRRREAGTHIHDEVARSTTIAARSRARHRLQARLRCT
jgi:hypothetical protein